MIQIHPIQTGTVRVKQFQLTGARNIVSRFWQLLFTKNWSRWAPIYCWLVEHPKGLFLVDTGETAKIYEEGYWPASAIFRASLEVQISRNDEVDKQIEALGFKIGDIKKIFLTHLHTDHVGGMYHFPNAGFYAPKAEYDVAIGPKAEGNGFLSKNFPEWFNPQLIEFSDGAEGNFPNSKKMFEDGSVVAVPTPGHSLGHLSYIIKDGDKRIVLAGDVTYDLSTLENKTPNTILSNQPSVESVIALKTYAADQNATVLTSHDPQVPAILAKLNQ